MHFTTKVKKMKKKKHQTIVSEQRKRVKEKKNERGNWHSVATKKKANTLKKICRVIHMPSKKKKKISFRICAMFGKEGK